jgi:hypothetical protein
MRGPCADDDAAFVQSGFKVPLSRSSSFALVVNTSATVSRYLLGNNKGERTMLLTVALVCLAVLALLVAMPAFIGFTTHNRLVALDQRCETAFGDVDVHLKHRHNLIPPLVETVRGFAKHESDILLGVTKARAEALQATSPEMQLTAEKNLTQNINALSAILNSRPRNISASCEGSLSAPRTASQRRAASTIWRSKNTTPRCANSPAATSADCSTCTCERGSISALSAC